MWSRGISPTEEVYCGIIMLVERELEEEVWQSDATGEPERLEELRLTNDLLWGALEGGLVPRDDQCWIDAGLIVEEVQGETVVKLDLVVPSEYWDEDESTSIIDMGRVDDEPFLREVPDGDELARVSDEEEGVSMATADLSGDEERRQRELRAVVGLLDASVKTTVEESLTPSDCLTEEEVKSTLASEEREVPCMVPKGQDDEFALWHVVAVSQSPDLPWLSWGQGEGQGISIPEPTPPLPVTNSVAASAVHDYVPTGASTKLDQRDTAN